MHALTGRLHILVCFKILQKTHITLDMLSVIVILKDTLRECKFGQDVKEVLKVQPKTFFFW